MTLSTHVQLPGSQLRLPLTPLPLAIAGDKTLRGTSGLLALLPSCSLLDQGVSSVGQESELSLLNTREPVAEAATKAGVDGVDPEGLLVEERAPLNAQLPQPRGNAWSMSSVESLVGMRRRLETYRTRSRRGSCGPC
jgi:hypothetical protein